MIGTYVSVAAMAALFVWMMNCGRFGLTRQMALVPLGIALVELMVAGVLEGGLFPVLTAILWGARLTVAGCCVGAMKLDACLARQKARERAERRARLRRAQLGTIAGRKNYAAERSAAPVSLVHTA